MSIKRDNTEAATNVSGSGKRPGSKNLTFKEMDMPYVEDKEVLFKDNIYFVEYKAVGQIAGSNPQLSFPHMRVKLSVDTVINIHARSQHKVLRIACDISELYDGENL